MDISVVIQQMFIIFILIMVGFTLHRINYINNDMSKQLSSIIVNVCNPALLLSSTLSTTSRIALSDLSRGIVIYGIIYGILIILAFIIPVVLLIQKNERYSYQMMCIFGNVGFIGIPLATAVLGADSLIYVSIFNLLYSFVFYTIGIYIMNKAARENGIIPPTSNNAKKVQLPGWINIGTIVAALTIILYILGCNLPLIVDESLSYIGKCTTFLSMVVLGVSVSTMDPKKVFTNIKLYIFVLIRLVAIPFIIISLLKIYNNDTLLISSTTIMLGVSFANMPLMLAKSLGLNDDNISGGIILSTLISLGTIPLLAFLVL